MFWNRFLSECKRIGKKPNPVARELGISSGTITGWKNGSIPKTSVLDKLATFFGCTTDYLLGLSDCRTAEETADVLLRLSEQEKILIKFFRDTTEEGRLEMIAAIMQIKKSVEKKNTDSDSEAIG